ncbi:MAG: thiamine pyrophosphate-dependent enzyme [Treponema sp.]|nr:thiamine pyrophosphate-dependent enzyme [Treponema sp.]
MSKQAVKINEGPLALLGDEAIALGALHAGISAAYGYPGTPSTEILLYLIEEAEKEGAAHKEGTLAADLPLVASWCSNEKTAFEAALGTSFAGKRSLVTTKHVGLNVAADPFMNSALLEINGGLVIAVADDPGMHSSQGEQDSRFYSSFGLVPCLEPRNQQQAYEMVREAFEVSEKFRIPVMLRFATRLAHSRSTVRPSPAISRNNLAKIKDRTQWILIPAYARQNYQRLLDKQQELSAWSSSNKGNLLSLEGRDLGTAVISSGLGGNYYEENEEDFAASRGGKKPAHLHIGVYPIPMDLVQGVCEKAEQVFVIEEGQPFIEQRLRGLLPVYQASGKALSIAGKLDGTFVRAGELDPDNVRQGLGLPPRPTLLDGGLKIPELPGRPPQLCQGCSHRDSYDVLNKVVAELDPAEGHPQTAICSDIGCYSLGAGPPYNAIESLVCMGASVAMARGAAEAGMKYAITVIGDSTFLHGGITCLVDAVQAKAPMTVIILDNAVVAMTGCQETIIPSEQLASLIKGLGVEAEHVVELEALGSKLEENAAKLKKEIEYRGVSVVIFQRICIEAFRKQRRRSSSESAAAAQ